MSRITGVMFIVDDDERTRAKQHAMLEIDEQYAKRWVKTMRELVDERLEDEEFTARRMSALHLWEKGRKREQRHLHYRYDPRRRNPKLVQADIDKMHEKLALTASKLEARMSVRVAEVSDTGPVVPQAPRVSAQTGESAEAPRVVKRAPARSLEHVHPGTVAMISKDLQTDALEYLTDNDVRDGYMINLGLTKEQAQQYVDILNEGRDDV